MVTIAETNPKVTPSIDLVLFFTFDKEIIPKTIDSKVKIIITNTNSKFLYPSK